MRPWEVVIETERLKASSPETIYAYLSELPPRDRRSDSDNLPDTVVDALIGIGHPLVDLGLARFAYNWERLKPLWDRSAAVRLALLANCNSGWVSAIDHLDEVFAEGDDNALEAILTNPSLGSGWLESAISNKRGLAESRWREIARLALQNHRLRRPLPHETWSEFTDAMEHDKPIQAVWRLYETVEPTSEWARVLSGASQVHFTLALPKTYLPDLSTDERRAEWNKTSMERHRRYEDDLVGLVSERWRTQDASRDEQLQPFFWARAAFATAASRTDGRLATKFKAHADQAFRRGYYEAAPVRSWPIEEYFERDGMEFIEGILANPTLYERNNYLVQRRVRNLAYDRQHSDDFRVGWFNARLEHWRAQDPQKYGDEPTPEMAEADRRAEAAEDARMNDECSRQAAQLRSSDYRPPRRNWGWIAAAVAVAVILLWRCTS